MWANPFAALTPLTPQNPWPLTMLSVPVQRVFPWGCLQLFFLVWLGQKNRSFVTHTSSITFVGLTSVTVGSIWRLSKLDWSTESLLPTTCGLWPNEQQLIPGALHARPSTSLCAKPQCLCISELTLFTDGHQFPALYQYVYLCHHLCAALLHSTPLCIELCCISLVSVPSMLLTAAPVISCLCTVSFWA